MAIEAFRQQSRLDSMPPRHSRYRHSGCLTCRTRRIKCDGLEPVCMRCAQTDLPCVSSRHVLERSPANTTGKAGASSPALVPHHSFVTSDLPVAIADQLILDPLGFDNSAGRRCRNLWLSSKQRLIASFRWSQPILRAICVCVESLSLPQQTRQHRVKAHELWSTALQGMMHKIRNREGTQAANIDRTIILWALLELAIDDGNQQSHFPAWRIHVSGLRERGLQRTPVGVTGELVAGADLIAGILESMCALAPRLDEFSSGTSTLRKLDVRKLHVEVRKLHKILVLLNRIRQKRPDTWCDSRTADNKCVLARHLIISTCLLLTLPVIHQDDVACTYVTGPNTAATVEPRPCRRHQRAQRMRSQLIRSIVDDAASLLGLQCVLPWNDSTEGQRPFCPPRMIEGILVLHPLAVALQQCERHVVEHDMIKSILWSSGQSHHLPKAMSLVMRSECGLRVSCAEVVDAMVLLNQALSI